MKKATLLVVDDTVENLDVLVELLDEYDVRDVLDAQSAFQVLRNEKIDLILLDIVLPNMNGYEFCSLLQKDPRTKDIPIIFITSMTDEESIEKAYDIGGKDYVTKPFKPKELLARLKMQLEFREMIKNLQYMAYHDPMTGIYNRRRFFELAIPMFEHYDVVYATMIDIDVFKKINDTYGHDVGDEVIISVAQTVSELLTKETVFGRLGGEEFAIISISKPVDEIINNIENIRKKIEDLSFNASNKTFHISISAGIAMKQTAFTNSKDIDSLLKLADDNLYEAKQSGRNKIIFK